MLWKTKDEASLSRNVCENKLDRGRESGVGNREQGTEKNKPEARSEEEVGGLSTDDRRLTILDLPSKLVRGPLLLPVAD
jgi:uncharacterized protein YceK